MKGSLRTQLVFWNIVALALLFAAMGVVVRYSVQTFIIRSIDHQLDSRLHPPAPHPPPPPGGFGPEPTNAPENGPPPGPPGAGPGPDDGYDPQRPSPPPGPFGGDHGPGFGPDQARDPYRPRMFDLQGRAVVPTTGEAAWDAAALAAAAQGTRVYETVTQSGQDFRVLTAPEPPNGPPRGVVQVAYPLTDVERALTGLTLALLLLIPVALACAAGAGILLTGRVLRRVALMARSANAIGVDNLEERLPATGNDEFAELAQTFNRLLGRLEQAFGRQREMILQQRRFTADASHELKTPITVIKANTSMALTAEALEPEEYVTALRDIDRSADSMSRLVQDLLLLARADAHQVGGRMIEVLLREIIDRAAASVPRDQAQTISVQFSDPEITVTCREDELTRVFVNLLDNALRYTRPGGTVILTAQTQLPPGPLPGRGDWVIVTIADCGPGIAPEHLPHLGERFYRVDDSRARTHGGSGLGLAICREIIAAHAGTLTIESTVGTGTTVTVRLPR